MAFFDTHFHLETMKEKGIDIESLSGIEGMDIGCEPGDIVRRLPQIRHFAGLHFSIGAGPWCAGKGKSAQTLKDEIVTDALKYRPDFIGEIGLDYYWNYGEKGEMEEIFSLQLDAADELGLPVVIHNRDADEAVLSIMRTKKLKRKGIIHCFSSTVESAKAFLDLGFMISFAGNVTYKSNEELRKAASCVPLDRILLETDSPYLSPVPLRGRLNSPLNIEHTYSLVSKLKNVSAEELDRIVRENYLSIL